MENREILTLSLHWYFWLKNVFSGNFSYPVLRYRLQNLNMYQVNTLFMLDKGRIVN